MPESDTEREKKADPFSLQGGLSLFVGASACLMGVLAMLSEAARGDGNILQPLAVAAGAGIVCVMCGWMWATKYYLPSRRAKDGRG